MELTPGLSTTESRDIVLENKNEHRIIFQFSKGLSVLNSIATVKRQNLEKARLKFFFDLIRDGVDAKTPIAASLIN